MGSMVSFHCMILLTCLTHLKRVLKSEDLNGHLLKLDPNKSGILDRFSFARWYLDEGVPLDSVEGAECLVCWGFKVSLMDIH